MKLAVDAMTSSNDHAELNWNPQRVPRAARIPDTEWEKYRVWICDLHQNGRTLEEIMTSVRSRCAEEGSSFEPT
jgi:hypothetical protein